MKRKEKVHARTLARTYAYTHTQTKMAIEMHSRTKNLQIQF